MARYAKISALSFERIENPYSEFEPEKLKIMMMNYLKEQFDIVRLENYFPLTYKLRKEYYEKIGYEV